MSILVLTGQKIPCLWKNKRLIVTVTVIMCHQFVFGMSTALSPPTENIMYLFNIFITTHFLQKWRCPGQQNKLEPISRNCHGGYCPWHIWGQHWRRGGGGGWRGRAGADGRRATKSKWTPVHWRACLHCLQLQFERTCFKSSFAHLQVQSKKVPVTWTISDDSKIQSLSSNYSVGECIAMFPMHIWET